MVLQLSVSSCVVLVLTLRRLLLCMPQVFVEQCRELDIAIAATSASAASMARQALLRRQAAAAAAAATAAGSTGGSAAAAAGAAGRPPLAAAAAGALAQVRLFTTQLAQHLVKLLRRC